MNATLSFFLLVALAVLGIESATIKPRCRCIQNAPEDTCAKIKAKMVKRIERFPAGPFCKKEEVIIHFQKGKTLCVDPAAKSLEKLERSIQPRSAANISTTSTPETTTADN
ncbi:alveolar macrophage chemotactic factor-like [Sardina pilchardus]|uniref:alveolar macrophage chemotactic factor-like n=1 Tax=Sardina pilchardus TaxID=27697 RepID=UPI002E11B661